MKYRKNIPLAFMTLALLSNLAFADDSENIGESESYKFVSLSLGKLDDLPSDHIRSISTDLTPSAGIGMGKSYFLSDDWQLNTELALETSRTHFHGKLATKHVFSDQAPVKVVGEYDETGIWATTRLTKVNGLGPLSPYIGIGFGVVHRDLTSNRSDVANQQNGLGLSYRLSSGLSYQFDNKSSISLEAKYSDAIGDEY